MKRLVASNSRAVVLSLRGTCLAAMSAALCYPSATNAQSTDNTAASPRANTTTIETVVVTARKRSEDVQSVPVAISVVSAAEIEQDRVYDVSRLAETVPGLYSGGNNQRAQVSMRGLTTITPDIGGDSSVGQYVDEVYQPRVTSQLTDLFDLDRIEVLKGPQGTLYGRNTIDGVINYVTKKPSDTFEGYATVGGGNRDSAELRAGLSGPIGDDLTGGISVMGRFNDGNVDVYNVAGKKIGDDGDSDYGVRGALRWTPSASLEVNLTAVRLSLDTANLDMVTGVGAGFTAFLVPPGTPYLDHNTDYKIVRDVVGYDDRVTNEIALRADWHLNDAVTLTSITSYQDYNLKLLNDLDYTFLPLFNNGTTEGSHTFSQEIRLSGDLEAFQWAVGANYFDDNHWQNQLDGYTDQLLASFGLPPSTPRPTYYTKVDTASEAVFGQGDYHITDQLTLTAGVRYTTDERNFHVISANQALNASQGDQDFNTATIPGLNTKPSWDNISYLVSLSYQITPDTMVYASRSTGFRAGGVQQRSETAAVATIPYGPEQVGQYEIGLKTTFLDDRVRLDIAAYDIDYKNVQVDYTPFGSAFDIIANAGSAASRGVEVQGSASLTDSLRADFSYAYSDAEFTHYQSVENIPAAISALNFGGGYNCSNVPPGTYGCSAADYKYNGTPFPGAPRNTFFFGLTYAHNILDNRLLTLHADYSWRDSIIELPLPQSFYPLGNKFLADNKLLQPAYGLFGATAALQISSDWSLSVWGRNLADQHYLVIGSVFPEAARMGQPTNFFYGDRRTYGADITYRW